MTDPKGELNRAAQRDRPDPQPGGLVPQRCSGDTRR